VCVPAASSDAIGGIDPTSFTDVSMSTLVPGATFTVDAIGVDPLTDDVVVAGAVDSTFDFGPDQVATGAFVVKLEGVTGGFLWAAAFPTFSHDRFRTAVLPGGEVFFAGTAFDPTTVGSAVFAPPAAGALVVGKLDAGGDPLWARAIPDTHPSAALVPAGIAASGGDLVVAGTGSADFGCLDGDTAAGAFAARLSGADGGCAWSRGFATRTLSDVEVREDGDVAVAGVCTPTGAFFDPGGGTTCASGVYVATLGGTDGVTVWARTSSGSGTVAAVRDLAVAPDGRTTVLGDARGAVKLPQMQELDFGAADKSFAWSLGPTGLLDGFFWPVEAPYAADPHALAFRRGAYDRASRLWIAGTYRGQPALVGTRFSPCRTTEAPPCEAAAFLARIDGTALAAPSVGSFLSIRAGPDPDGAAYVDDLVLAATTGSVAAALRFTGTATVDGASWASAGGDLAVLRAVP
jgi:hypothetical protein